MGEHRRNDAFDEHAGPFRNNAGGERSSRTRAFLAILNLTIAASFCLLPLVFGYAWNSSAGFSILNVRREDRRYPAANITAEPWGASVVLGPAESRLREYFSGRHLPLWNPYQGLGEPYAAQGDGSPYSLPALARALLPPWAGNLVTFGVFAIGAAGMFALLRLAGLSQEVGFFGGLATFLSTALTFHIARYNIADQNALIPVQFAVTAWAIRRRTPLTYLALACSTAMSITAGFVPSAAVTIAIASLFGAVLIWTTLRQWRDKGFAFAGLIAATSVGLALSAPFWLPIAELSQIGYHKNVPSITVYRPPPYNLAAFFFPSLLGEPLTFTSLGPAGILVDWNNLFATSSACVLLLCLIGLFACQWNHRGHRILFCFAIACVTLLVLRFMHWPPFSLLSRDMVLAQHATKHTQAVAAFLALLASLITLEHYKNWVHARLRWVYIVFLSIPGIVFCVARIHSGHIRGFRTSFRYLLITLVLAATLAAIFRMFRRSLSLSSPSVIAAVGVVICAELSFYLPLGTRDPGILYARLFLCVAWIVACCSILAGRHLLAAALAAVTLVCYSAVVALPGHGLPNQIYSRTLPAFADFLRARTAGQYRSFGIFPAFSSQAMVRDIGVVGPFAPSGFAALIHSIDPEGALGFYGSNVFLLAGRPSWSLDLNRYIQYRALFDWIGVRYLVLERALLSQDAQAFLALPDEGSSSFRVVFADHAVTIVESSQAKRRFEFSSSPTILRSQAAIIRELQSDPGMVDRTVLLESSSANPFLEELAANADASGGAADIHLLEESPNSVRLKLNNSRGGILVVKDSYFPGWEALVDGTKAPILRVNGMVRGVEIAGPGPHIVELRYRPSSFWYGVLVGGLAFTLFLVLLFWPTTHPRAVELRLVPVGLICLFVVATAPAVVIPRERATLRLGRYETAVAIDLRNVPLNWRETDSSNGRELFTRAVRVTRLPLAVGTERDIPLHVGDLVYLPNTGLAEIDHRGRFQEVAAAEGRVIPLCRLFVTTDKQDGGAAMYQRGRWQIIPLGTPSGSSLCHLGENLG